MILQKKTINNVPTLVPLTADTGSGVPVGTIIGQYKKVNMAGYLYLDGSTFDQTLYPALYAYLGTNVLPDYREFVLVGAEQNTTSATIATHDVFTQGQEKDDQFRSHSHRLTINADESRSFYLSGGSDLGDNISSGAYNTVDYSRLLNTTFQGGTTTRTKEKAVFWYIKATIGSIEDTAADQVLTASKNYTNSIFQHDADNSKFALPTTSGTVTANCTGILYVTFKKDTSNRAVLSVYEGNNLIYGSDVVEEVQVPATLLIRKGREYRWLFLGDVNASVAFQMFIPLID